MSLEANALARALRALAIALGALAFVPGALVLTPAASALPAVSLNARFSPDHAGDSTTVHFGFTISQPAPLRSAVLHLPPGMGFAGSSLGLESCSEQQLGELGPEGCPADSVLGVGTAQAEVLAETTVQETAKVTAIDGPQVGPEMSVLFFVDGRTPVNREAVLPGLLTLPSSESTSSTLTIEVPLLDAWFEGPDIGVLAFSSTIGPEGLTYYRTVHDRRVRYEPRGLSVPRRCPRAGFPITGSFEWWGLEGTVTTHARVACPRARRTRAATRGPRSSGRQPARE